MGLWQSKQQPGGEQIYPENATYPIIFSNIATASCSGSNSNYGNSNDVTIGLAATGWMNLCIHKLCDIHFNLADTGQIIFVII